MAIVSANMALCRRRAADIARDDCRRRACCRCGVVSSRWWWWCVGDGDDSRCPLAGDCRALAEGDPLRYPGKKPKKAIPVRRTLLFLENSIRRSLQAFVFEPNDANTWSSIQQTTEAFLNGLWRSGAFAGSTERHAYNVRCGLGSTMSRADLNAKRIKVQVAVALVRPAAFSIVTLTLRLHS